MTIKNSITKHIILPITDRLNGTSISRYWSNISDMSLWSSSEIKDWQNEKLKNLISHIYHHTVYYKEMFNKYRLKPSDIKDISDLQKLPVMTKEDIINNSEKLIPDNLNNFRYKNVATGGSTGVPLKYRIDMQSYSYATATRYHHWENNGYNFGDRLAVLGGRSIIPDYENSRSHNIYHYFIHKYSLNGINMSDQVCDRYLDFFIKKKIKYIYGYASAIYLLASRAEKRGIEFPDLDVCFTTGEMNPDEYREKIISVFNCKLIDIYGAMDGGISTYELNTGAYYVGYNSIVEIENQANGSNSGNILITDLFNYTSPFIRYQIGDQVALFQDNELRNKYNGQIISKVWGRDLDIIRLENGHVLTGIGFTGYFRTLNVRAFRIEKIAPMHIECTIQKNDQYTNDEEDHIIATFKQQTGEECKISFKYVEKLESTPSGKNKYFIANI